MIIETKTDELLAVKAAPMAKKYIDPETPNDIIVLLSDEYHDSDGDVVHQRKTKHGDGWLLNRFNKAPVITWQHNMQIPNLSGPRTRAKVDKIPAGGYGLHLNPLQFDEADAFAMVLDDKIRRDIIKESSAGFKIKKWQPRVVEGQRVGMDIYEQLLLEAAIANRGANPNTEIIAKSLIESQTPDIQTAGDKMAADAVAEIEHLNELVAMLGNEIKALGDTVSRLQDGNEQSIRAVLKARQDARNVVAGELLERLKVLGVAR